MSELETMLVTIITNYGLPALILGCITIFLIGVLKYFDIFRKIPKDNRKPIYLALNYIIVFALTAAYYGMFKLRFTDYVPYAFVVATVVNLLYPLYENLKIRELLGAVGRFIVKKVAKKQLEAEKTIVAEPNNANKTDEQIVAADDKNTDLKEVVFETEQQKVEDVNTNLTIIE